MINASCHCGNVEVEINDLPESLTSCNCSICNRYGALWGYYKAAEVVVKTNMSELKTYTWGDEYIDFHHCGNCGCVTHYTSRPKSDMDRVGVNFRMFDRELVTNISKRHFDGANW